MFYRKVIYDTSCMSYSNLSRFLRNFYIEKKKKKKRNQIFAFCFKLNKS